MSASELAAACHLKKRYLKCLLKHQAKSALAESKMRAAESKVMMRQLKIFQVVKDKVERGVCLVSGRSMQKAFKENLAIDVPYG